MTKGRRQKGNALLICLLVLALLSALTVAQVSLVQKNIRQSNFYHARMELREYAESALAWAIHDLNFDITGYDGKAGTTLWSTADDLGKDGAAATFDQGEGDGLPTAGEPNIIPNSIGPFDLSAGAFVHVADTAVPEVKRILATSVNPEAEVTVEAFIRRTISTIPRNAPLFVDPSTSLTVFGAAFVIDGRDYNMDGTPGTESPVYGIATTHGTPAGDNAAALVSSVPAPFQSQIEGKVGAPSIGEVDEVDTDAIFAYLKQSQTQSVASGVYANDMFIDLGDSALSDYRNTYVDGDLTLMGNVKGAGVLVVNGDLTMSGQSRFDGLVIVRGSTSFTGGGSGVHIYGSVWTMGSTLNVTGATDIYYSSQALDAAEGLIGSLEADFSVVYYSEM